MLYLFGSASIVAVIVAIILSKEFSDWKNTPIWKKAIVILSWACAISLIIFTINEKVEQNKKDKIASTTAEVQSESVIYPRLRIKDTDVTLDNHTSEISIQDASKGGQDGAFIQEFGMD